jgi:hypothetical protein
MQLDIAFSDHHLSHKTLNAFGAVIRAIGAATTDEAVRFWTFIAYISKNHPAILTARVPAEWAQRVDDLLRNTSLPQVDVAPSFQAKKSGSGEKNAFEITLGAEFADAVRHHLKAPVLANVEVRLADGTIAGPYLLICDNVRVQLFGRGKAPKIEAASVVAIRQRFSLLLPFRNRPWIELPAANPSG